MKKGAKQALDKFLELKEKYLDTVVIAEGPNDKKALEAIGFKKVLILNKALFRIIESVTDKNVSILTDLDSEGKKLYFLLKKGFTQRGVFVDNKLRDLLFKTELRQIEGLTSYIETMSQSSL